MTLRQVLYRVITGGSGAPNFLPRATAGVSVLRRFTMRVGSIVAGVQVLQRARLTPRLTTGVALTPRNSGSTRPQLAPGIAASNRRLTGRLALHTPAFEVVRSSISLTHRAGANAAANLGPQNFSNPTNAQGLANATLAVHSGAATASSATLTLDYADFANKDQLTISAVRVHLYIRQVTTLNNGNFRIQASWTGQALTQIAGPYAGAVDFLASPVVVDLFAMGCDTWAKLSSLQVRALANTPAAGLGTNSQVDAVELEVTAARIDAL